MSSEMSSNWHIANYLWRDTPSRTLTMQIVEQHTRVKIEDCETFMKECLRENGDYADIGYHQAPRYEPEITELSRIAEGE